MIISYQVYVLGLIIRIYFDGLFIVIVSAIFILIVIILIIFHFIISLCICLLVRLIISTAIFMISMYAISREGDLLCLESRSIHCKILSNLI